MSASIHYRPTSTKDPTLQQVGSPSQFIEIMKRAFGNFPCSLGIGEVRVLRGMSAMCRDNWVEYGIDPYMEIIDIIEKIGSIQLYASY